MRPEFTLIDNYGLVMKFLTAFHPDAKQYWTGATHVEVTGNDLVKGKYLVAIDTGKADHTLVVARYKFSDHDKAAFNIPNTNTGAVVWCGNMNIDAVKIDPPADANEVEDPNHAPPPIPNQPPQEKRSTTEWMSDNALYVALAVCAILVFLWWRYIR